MLLKWSLKDNGDLGGWAGYEGQLDMVVRMFPSSISPTVEKQEMGTPEEIHLQRKDYEFGLGYTEFEMLFPSTEASKHLPHLSATTACSICTITKVILESMQQFTVL